MSFYHGKAELRDVGHCFVSLPAKWNLKSFVANQFNLVILKIIFLDDLKCDKYVYVSWNGTRNHNSDFVIFDRQFASKLKIGSGESILVQAVDDSSKFAQCISIDIRPLTHDDYQLIEVNSGELEQVILDQLRVVTTAFCKESEPIKFNVVPIWLKSSPNVPIFVEICNFEPKNPHGLILVNSTKLEIHSPDKVISFTQCSSPSPTGLIKSEESFSALRSVFGLFRSIIPVNPPAPFSNTSPSHSAEKMSADSTSRSIPLYKGQPLLLRVLPHQPDKPDNTLPLCTAFISPVHFKSCPEKYCLVKLKQISTVIEKLEEAKKKHEHHTPSPIDVSSLSSPEERFNTQFVDTLLRTFEESAESFILVLANPACSPNSIQLNESFRVLRSIAATSYVQLSKVSASESSQKMYHFDQIDYLSLPIVPQLTLCPINSNRLHLDSWADQLRTQIKEQLLSASTTTFPTEHHNFDSLCFLNTGNILKLGDFYFTAHSNETLSVDLDRCNWQKLRDTCFLLDGSTEIVVKVVQVKANTTKLLTKWAKGIQELDATHLHLLYSDSAMTKPFGGFAKQFTKCADFIRVALQLEKDKPRIFGDSVSLASLFGSLLITGAKGAGKSTFVGRMMTHFARQHFAYCHTIQCSHIKGKRIESLQKLWLNAVQEAIQRQPSIVLFEDLDEIAYYIEDRGDSEAAASRNENAPLESVYCERVSHVFVRTIKILHRLKGASQFCGVAIVATAKSVSALNRILTKANIFNEVIELSPPDLKQRADIIEQIIQHKDLSLPGHQLRPSLQFNVQQLSRTTKSYNPEDLNQLLDIAVHNALMSTLSFDSSSVLPESLAITEQNVQYALSQFTPAHLSGTNLHIRSSRSMADVGGLHQVKQLVLDTILLPVKYPKVYAHLPLRSQNSILLYGIPGTGKTMLVEAIANESGLNFIGVKGPELLSKYIGASEQSVRDLFARAQAAAPCILFFDEFDSLAPRRGHDSTGVTDRIVNQMLTLLDGLEEMKRGVYILAATSRPDLIDLALLRPGRFDRCVPCALPSKEERTEILEALARKLNIDAGSVQLDQVASRTDHFTGADLQALLYNAYLCACKRTTPSDITGRQPVIIGEDMEHALQHTAPSLSDKERTKFALIYERFVRELSGQFVPSPQQKATLA